MSTDDPEIVPPTPFDAAFHIVATRSPAAILRIVGAPAEGEIRVLDSKVKASGFVDFAARLVTQVGDHIEHVEFERSPASAEFGSLSIRYSVTHLKDHGEALQERGLALLRVVAAAKEDRDRVALEVARQLGRDDFPFLHDLGVALKLSKSTMKDMTLMSNFERETLARGEARGRADGRLLILQRVIGARFEEIADLGPELVAADRDADMLRYAMKHPASKLSAVAFRAHALKLLGRNA